MTANHITGAVIGAAIDVHNELGPGLLESAYEACLFHELMAAGWPVERQKKLPLLYKGVQVDCGYRIDMLIGGRVVVELKSVEKLDRIHTATMLTYLKLSGCKTGLIINFNVLLLKDGIRRVIL